MGHGRRFPYSKKWIRNLGGKKMPSTIKKNFVRQRVMDYPKSRCFYIL
jgi:hypothetical protein